MPIGPTIFAGLIAFTFAVGMLIGKLPLNALTVSALVFGAALLALDLMARRRARARPTKVD
jgi:hypothetical protein